jgi:hypothetical protein
MGKGKGAGNKEQIDRTRRQQKKSAERGKMAWNLNEKKTENKFSAF